MAESAAPSSRRSAWERAFESPAAALFALGFLLGGAEVLLHACWHPGRAPLGLDARGWLRAVSLALVLYGLCGAVLGLLFSACCGWWLAKRGSRANEDARRGASFLFGWGALALEAIWWSRFAALSGESFFSAARLFEAAVISLVVLPLAVLVASWMATSGPRLALWASSVGAALLLMSGVLPPRTPANERDPRERTGATERPSVLLIVVDALRGDHCVSPSEAASRRGTCGWYAQAMASQPEWKLLPALEGFAARGTYFDRAITAAPSTWPSLASLFTGTLPSEHGVLRMSAEQRMAGLEGTLAESLRRRGYRTAALVSGALSNGSGLLRGFDELFELSTGRARFALDDPWSHLRAELAPLRVLEKLRSKGDPERVSSEAVRYLDEVGTEPFFLYVHLYATHVPYEPPARYRDHVRMSSARTRFTAEEALAIEEGRWTPSDAEWREIRMLYSACAAWADAQIARVLEALSRTGRSEKTIVVVTADHGEELGDHEVDGVPCIEHDWMWNTNLHVPLLMAGPGIPGGHEILGARSLADLKTTLERLVDGGAISDRDALRPDEPHVRTAVAVSENALYGAAQDRYCKLLREKGGARRELWFDLVPFEAGGLEAAAFEAHCESLDRTPDQIHSSMQRLRNALDEIEASASRRAGRGGAAVLEEADPGVEQALRAAGYLGGTRPRAMITREPK